MRTVADGFADAPVGNVQVVRRRRAAFAAGCVVVVWAAVAAVIVGLAAEQALLAQHRVLSSRHLLLEGNAGGVEGDLTVARSRFARADTLANSPVLLPLRVIPGIGRQVASFDALARAGRTITTALARAARNMPRVDAGQTTADRRVNLLAAAARVARALRADITGIDLGPRTWLLPPLAARRTKLASDLDGIRRAADVSTALAPFLRGTHHYLVLAANNAEMRAGSGMFLSAGALTIDDGHFAIGEMSSTVDLRVPNGSVPLDADMQREWGWLHPNQEWRNVNVTPRFDASARLAAGMWRAIGRGPVDGVIAVDPVALEGLLAATGPVDVDGTRINADNVVRYLLHDQYIGVPATDTAKAARRERLGRLAGVVLEAVERGGWDPATLVRHVGSAVGGRHLMAWSSDPAQERMWQRAGMDGRVRPDRFAVSLLNRNGTKLDQFMHIDATLRHGPGQSGTLAVRIRNATPAGGEPLYVVGPHPLSRDAAGEYNGILLVTLPEHATNVGIEHERRVAVDGADGTSRVIGLTIDLVRGASRTIVVTFTLPRSSFGILPSARVPEVAWWINRRSWHDGLKIRLEW